MMRTQPVALRLIPAGSNEGGAGPVLPFDRVKPQPRVPRTVRTIAVTSGKGGVGKTNLTANLAVAFARAGHRVLAVDGDLGLANLDIILGITPEKTLLDVISGGCSIEDVLVTGPQGVRILAACSGRYELANLTDTERMGLFSSIDTLDDHFDILLIDTAAGIGSNSVAFAAAARDIVLIATPEPTSLADAYGMIKVLVRRCRVTRIRLVANMVASAREGEEVYRRLSLLVDRFLNVGLDYLGYIYRDDAVLTAVSRHQPFVIGFPDAPAARCIEGIANKLVSTHEPTDSGGIGLFWRKLLTRDDEPQPGAPKEPERGPPGGSEDG